MILLIHAVAEVVQPTVEVDKVGLVLNYKFVEIREKTGTAASRNMNKVEIEMCKAFLHKWKIAKTDRITDYGNGFHRLHRFLLTIKTP
jgi:hypothetical protein